MSIPASFLPVMLRGIARRADTTAADKAATKMAKVFLRGVSDVELLAIENPRGPGKAHGVPGARSWAPLSPAPPGGPPAHVSGHLRSTGHARLISRGDAVAYWTAVYAAMQEFGGSRGGISAYLASDGWHYFHGASTEARPYVRRGVERMSGDGQLRDAAIDGFREADIFAGWEGG